MGLQSRQMVIAPLLMKPHRQKRLQLSRQYRHWTVHDWQSSQMSHVFCVIEQIAVGVSGEKHQRTNTLQPLLKEHKLLVAALWSGECFRGILWAHSSMWKALSTDLGMNPSLQITYTHTCCSSSLGRMGSSSKTMRHVTWLEMSNIGWKSMNKTSKYYPGPLNPQT